MNEDADAAPDDAAPKPAPAPARPPVGLDLVEPEAYAPALRKLSALAAGAGLVAALLAAVLVGPTPALAVFLVIAAPTVLTVAAVRRRRMWLADGVIHARGVLGERRVAAAAATEVSVLVLPGRISRVALRITAGGPAITVPLALYTGGPGAEAGEARGRELPLLGLRGLADALAAAPLAAALALSSVLVAQLRAEARDAPLEQRPLYRAVRAALDAGHRRAVVLSDREIADLA